MVYDSKPNVSVEIALIHPDIPQNVGNISRLCVGLEATLHLVKPMSFVLDDRRVRRAGLDYWPHLKLVVHESLDDFLSATATKRRFFYSTKATQTYTAAQYKNDDVLIFGSESKGLPATLLAEHMPNAYQIPMWGKVRSLNLSNAAAVVAYEAMRQIRPI